MRTFNETLKCHDMELLSHQEMQDCYGGGFAYDAGFFLREMWIFMSNGGSIFGTRAVTIDTAVNYRPK